MGVCSPPAGGELHKRIPRPRLGRYQDQTLYSERRVTVDRHCLLTPQGKANEFQATGRHHCWSASLFPAYVGLSPFEARRVIAPPTPMEMVCRPSHYGRTETGDDILKANQEAFKSATKNATTEAMWLDQLGVDFTRWKFTLTPDGEHIASATIYLQDSNDVSELMYEATQKCIPGATGYYRRWLTPNGVVDDAILHVEIP